MLVSFYLHTVLSPKPTSKGFPNVVFLCLILTFLGTGSIDFISIDTDGDTPVLKLNILWKIANWNFGSSLVYYGSTIFKELSN